MSTRHLIAAITFAVITTCTQSASACALSDWLFGRQRVYAAGYTPYTAGYAPYAAARPVAINYNGAYAAQRPAVLNNPSVYSGLPVMPAGANNQVSYSLPIGGTAAPVAVTAVPTTPYPATSVTAARVPIAQTLRGIAPTSTGLFGGGNAYPSQSYNLAPYGAARPTVVTGAPATALPTTPVATPFAASATPARPAGGLARFFGSMLGTDYRSNYYRAPVTYYRPLTSVDPITGTTVTTQQPCTAYEQQLQRVPVRNLAPAGNVYAAPATALPQTNPSCSTTLPPSNSVQGYSQIAPSGNAPVTNPYGSSQSYAQPPYSQAPLSGIGQAGAALSPGGQSVVPIPSIEPSYGGPRYGTPNTAPLTGNPYGDTRSGDQAPLDQPRLESARPQYDTYGRDDIDRYSSPSQARQDSYLREADPRDTDSVGSIRRQTPRGDFDRSDRDVQSDSFRLTPPDVDSSSTDIRSQWQLQNPADSSIFGRSQSNSADRMISTKESIEGPRYSDLPPIEAPSSYQSPFSAQKLVIEPEDERKPMTAPPLPKSSPQTRPQYNSDDFLPRPDLQISTSVKRARHDVPVREAALVRDVQPTRYVEQSRRVSPQPMPKTQRRRQSSWYSLKP